MKQKVGEHTVRSIKEWNNLEKNLKELKYAKALKKKVMNNLLSRQNSDVNFLLIWKMKFLHVFIIDNF